MPCRIFLSRESGRSTSEPPRSTAAAAGDVLSFSNRFSLVEEWTSPVEPEPEPVTAHPEGADSDDTRRPAAQQKPPAPCLCSRNAWRNRSPPALVPAWRTVPRRRRVRQAGRIRESRPHVPVQLDPFKNEKRAGGKGADSADEIECLRDVPQHAMPLALGPRTPTPSDPAGRTGRGLVHEAEFVLPLCRQPDDMRLCTLGVDNPSTG